MNGNELIIGLEWEMYFYQRILVTNFVFLFTGQFREVGRKQYLQVIWFPHIADNVVFSINL